MRDGFGGGAAGGTGHFRHAYRGVDQPCHFLHGEAFAFAGEAQDFLAGIVVDANPVAAADLLSGNQVRYWLY